MIPQHLRKLDLFTLIRAMIWQYTTLAIYIMTEKESRLITEKRKKYYPDGVPGYYEALIDEPNANGIEFTDCGSEPINVVDIVV